MREKLVRTLLQLGHIVNPKDVDNPGLLIDVIKKGYLKVVEDLLIYREEINMLIDDYSTGLTPLHRAVKWKQLRMAKLLINYGANVNVKDGKGTTPIVDAIKNGTTEMIELLLHNGADIKEHPELLYTAVMNNNLKVTKLLLKYGADTRSRKSRTPLLCTATENENLEIIECLLWHGIDINASDHDGRTALHYTVVCYWYDYCSFCENGYNSCYNKEIAELLLSKGANVNVATKSGITTLSAASRKGYKDFVEILLKYGAEVDPGAEDVIKPLHAAAVGGHLKIIENLIKFGAEVDSRDIYGRTALHFASRGGHKKIVKTLLEYGSDVNIISKKDHTPLEYSKFIKDFDNDGELDDYHYDFDSDDVDNDEYLSYVYDSPTTKLLEQHMVKMKIAGLHVSYKNWQWITDDRRYDNLIIACEAEIEIMKSTKIDNSHASFHDILTKNTSQLAKNESIVQALKSDNYKTKFPIYASMIDSRFRRGIERKELLVQVRDKFLKILPKLPFLCTEKICSYLSDKDLRILLVNCKP
ncbi:uncharacterized protein LOC143207476 [Lasioglossum baleicum]|uniref:uncharacterized protein LOC143207476 n=1 Tax=Lasioglossum baleicum TaxID=434251 RepID=UPI003FCD7B48